MGCFVLILRTGLDLGPTDDRCTRPSATRRSMGRGTSTGRIRATACPWSVTTSSSPWATPARYLLRWLRRSRMPTSTVAPHCSYIETTYCSHFVRDPCAMRGEMVVIRGRERSLKSACEQDFLQYVLSKELTLGRSQRRSRRFESAHLHQVLVTVRDVPEGRIRTGQRHESCFDPVRSGISMSSVTLSYLLWCL
jgi:hypothetical protein